MYHPYIESAATLSDYYYILLLLLMIKKHLGQGNLNVSFSSPPDPFLLPGFFFHYSLL